MLSIDSEFYQEMKVFLCCNLKKKEKKVYGVLHGFTERKPFITVQQNEYLPQSFSETV